MNISILSVGPGDPGLLNEQTKGLLCKGENLILRTDKSFLVQWLHEKNIPFSSLDYLYDSASDFDDLSEKAAETVWNSAKKNSSVLYAVSDFISDRTVDLIKNVLRTGRSESFPVFHFLIIIFPAAVNCSPHQESRFFLHLPLTRQIISLLKPF